MPFLTNYNISLSIGTAQAQDGTWTYAELCAGWDNITEALNETVQQYFFFCQGGYATNHVTGMAPAVTLTGRRILGDTAQDYIFSNKYELGENRQSSFKLSFGSGASATTLTCPCTMCNIQELSGATTDDSAISVEFRFDGKPTVTVGA